MSNESWDQLVKLAASDPMDENLFGWVVAMDGDYAVVGAQGNTNYTGAVYVFHYDGMTWILQARLVASDGARAERFGYSVGIDGDTIIVGANLHAGTGAAYIFVRDGTSWTQQAELTASDGLISDEFGDSVAVSGDTAVVGAAYAGIGGDWSGSAYVYKRTGTSWAEEAKLRASDAAASDQFGWSIAIDGDTVVVGSVYDESQTGSAYVFTRSGTTWTQAQKLVANDAAVEDAFGVSVAIDGNSIAIGAGWKNTFVGAAYVFVYDGSSWVQQAELTASDGTNGNEFGMAVDISGDRVAVGARFVNMWTGEAYIFDRDGTTWSEAAHFNATDGEYFDQFGWSIALDGNMVLMGAPGELAPYRGAAYMFWHPIPKVPNLVLTVTGGLGLTVSVFNNGTANATNVNVSIGSKSVVLPSIAPNASATAKFWIFGLGKKTIAVTAICDEGPEANWTGSAFVLLIFILGLK